jgi:hypothetical protein
VRLAFDQANVACPRALGRVLDLEFDSLTFAQELEDGAANRAAVKEMLDPALVADETEPLVDQKASDGTRRHTSVLREHFPQGNPEGYKLSAGSGRRRAARIEGEAPTRRTYPHSRRVWEPQIALSLKTGPV